MQDLLSNITMKRIISEAYTVMTNSNKTVNIIFAIMATLEILFIIFCIFDSIKHSNTTVNILFAIMETLEILFSISYVYKTIYILNRKNGPLDSLYPLFLLKISMVL